MEYRHARAAAIDPIEHQAMQMDVEIGPRAKALDERDCTGVSLGALQSRLLDQKCGNDAVNALQQRCFPIGEKGGLFFLGTTHDLWQAQCVTQPAGLPVHCKSQSTSHPGSTSRFRSEERVEHVD